MLLVSACWPVVSCEPSMLLAAWIVLYCTVLCYTCLARGSAKDSVSGGLAGCDTGAVHCLVGRRAPASAAWHPSASPHATPRAPSPVAPRSGRHASLGHNVRHGAAVGLGKGRARIGGGGAALGRARHAWHLTWRLGGCAWYRLACTEPRPSPFLPPAPSPRRAAAGTRGRG